MALSFIKEFLEREEIGISEKFTDKSFKKREKEKPGYTNGRCSGKKFYQYAELKSSLLINEITKDGGITFIEDGMSVGVTLVEFINTICERYCNTIGLNYDDELTKYAQISTNFTGQGTRYNPYPVCNMVDFHNNPELIKNDFYASYNFLKVIWMYRDEPSFSILKNVSSIEDISRFEASISLNYLIDGVQQKLAYFIEEFKGPRKNLKGSSQEKTHVNQLGISNLIHEDLIRPHSWKHPGRVQCRVPYKSIYGQHLSNENNMDYPLYGSVQCGISGSVNFGIYMYLASIANTTTDTNSEKDAAMIILATTSILVADGGHNVRETITGLTLMSIAMKELHTQLNREITDLPGKTIQSKIDTLIDNLTKNKEVTLADLRDKGNLLLEYTIYDISEYMVTHAPVVSAVEQGVVIDTYRIFGNWIMSFLNWGKFIDSLHNWLKIINPSGISKSTNIFGDRLTFTKGAIMKKRKRKKSKRKKSKSKRKKSKSKRKKSKRKKSKKKHSKEQIKKIQYTKHNRETNEYIGGGNGAEFEDIIDTLKLNDEYSEFLNYIKENVYDSWFTEITDKKTLLTSNATIIFSALENNRYENSTVKDFLEGPSTVLSNILSYGELTDIEETVNISIQDRLNRCNVTRIKSEEIPYA